MSTHSTALDGKPTPTIDEIVLADDPANWEALGFDVSAGMVGLGDVRVRLADASSGRGIVGWSLRDLANIELDGLPTTCSQLPLHTESVAHPNGVLAIDHVVAMSPQLDRTVGALREAGLDLRRVREEPTPMGAPRQAFFRLGPIILEVIQEPAEALERSPEPHASTRFWGLALLAGDIDRTAARLGEHVSEIRPAVQPGRRIATLRRSAGLAIPVALMSPASDRHNQA